jgi:rhodanese-related sulfurtransferase
VITERLRRKVTFLSPQDALAMQKRGVPVIDIRPEPDWAVSRVRGSVGVPFMRLIKGNSFRKNLRRAGFAFFGIFQGTEFNPHFYDQVAASVDKMKGAVIVCNYGGTLLPLGEGGRQSRSIHAAYELVEQGYSSICILDGGFGAWQKEDLPVDDAPAPEASTDA